MHRRLLASTFMGLGVLLLPGIAMAHVVVTPKQVGVAAEQVFSISVPTEKDSPTVAVRLLVPDGVTQVTPTVKPGWQIDTKKSGDTVTEIDWTGGSVPAGQRDDFAFSAQAPSKATEVHWKAYQTYGDGSVVSWDQTPTNTDDATGDKGPYSVTKVVNDIASASSRSSTGSPVPWGAYALSGVALLFSIVALVARRKPQA